MNRQILRLPVRPRPLPATGVMELWLTNLSFLALAEVGAAGGRVEQVRSRKLRQRFVLRLLLGSYLGCPGKDVRIQRGAHGKPELVPGSARPSLQFSLSHSGDWLAVAVTRDQALGVDIERQRELPRALALARRFLSGAEAERIESLPEPDRAQLFFRLWSRREALIKAMGSSLAESLSEIELDPDRLIPTRLPSGWPQPAHWQFADPALPVGLVGALVTFPQPCRLVTLELDCRPDLAA